MHLWSHIPTHNRVRGKGRRGEGGRVSLSLSLSPSVETKRDPCPPPPSQDQRRDGHLLSDHHDDGSERTRAGERTTWETHHEQIAVPGRFWGSTPRAAGERPSTADRGAPFQDESGALAKNRSETGLGCDLFFSSSFVSNPPVPPARVPTTTTSPSSPLVWKWRSTAPRLL